MKDFILETRKDFTYVGEEYRVQVCANKDEQVVEYTMSRTISPTIVSQYTLKLIDKKLLENKLKEIKDIV